MGRLRDAGIVPGIVPVAPMMYSMWKLSALLALASGDLMEKFPALAEELANRAEALRLMGDVEQGEMYLRKDGTYLTPMEWAVLDAIGEVNTGN